jgi:hypothetical protein
MSLVVSYDLQDAAHVPPTFTLRPKPDRRKAPRVAVGPGNGLICYIRQEPEPAYVAGARVLEHRESLAAFKTA